MMCSAIHSVRKCRVRHSIEFCSRATLWELWNAFFTAVVTSSTSRALHLALLDALHVQAPTQPKNIPAGSDGERQLRSFTQADRKLHWPALPRFSAQWRDVHDILEAWRDWDGAYASGAGDNSAASTLSSSGDKYYLGRAAESHQRER